MAWLPISGTLPQYSTANNGLAADYYIKFYASGTTTPINMATDSTGGTTLAKCALSADGYPISNPLDDSTRFIPHIDQDYRIVMYLNETDADNNTTASAAFNIDGMVLQVVPTGDAANITLRDVTIEEQDDYDRSPLFIDGTDFTAGAGPHVITVPTDWTPTNADMRFYRLDNSGIVTALTPSSTSSTTFTLAETLLSTDVIFIGDDDFRELFGHGSDTDITNGVEGSVVDAKGVKDYLDGYYGSVQETTLDYTDANAGDFTGGSIRIVRVGNVVTIAGYLAFSASDNAFSDIDFLPDWALPTPSSLIHVEFTTGAVTNWVAVIRVDTNGRLFSKHFDWTGAGYSTNNTGSFSITYPITP